MSTDLVIERVHEQSRIRRGRAAVDPTFYVRTPGWRWRFSRKKDAQRFINNDGSCELHDQTSVSRCTHCFGWRYAITDEKGTGDGR